MDEPSIADYAVIGDGLSAALLSRAGAVDWLCWPRFDSPAALCRLLDRAQGGYLELAPAGMAAVERRYLPDTAILESVFRAGDGVVRVVDFMPIDDLDAGGEGAPRRLVRRVEGLGGRVTMEVAWRPSFDFARASPTIEAAPFGAVARAGRERLALRAPAPLSWRHGALRGRFDLAAGEAAELLLTRDVDDVIDVDAALARTAAEWRRWTGKCRDVGRWRAPVLRSAITLKLLTYRPTGAIIAAPTTSLPEELGGPLNWDYRYSWLRDSALGLEALLALGHHDEAMRYWGWLEGLGLGGGELDSLYRVDGARVAGEERLEHLAGYRGSQPVRIGNAAAGQLQLDAFGSIVDAAYLCIRSMRVPHPHLVPVLRALADRAAAGWRSPDHGIWEVRDHKRHFVYSKIGCWLALDRALRLAALGWLSGDVDRWRAARAAVRDAVLTRGVDPARGLVRAFEDRSADASLLRAASLGFLAGDDPRMRATIATIRGGLGEGDLLRRYLGEDGLPGADGAFVACSFWLVEALALAGRGDEAGALFERLLARTNDVGLLAEEIDPATGEFLGNFPQALSHLALIRAALTLEAAAI